LARYVVDFFFLLQLFQTNLVTDLPGPEELVCRELWPQSHTVKYLFIIQCKTKLLSTKCTVLIKTSDAPI